MTHGWIPQLEFENSLAFLSSKDYPFLVDFIMTCGTDDVHKRPREMSQQRWVS